MCILHGMSVSKGIAIAPAYVFLSDTTMMVPRYYVENYNIKQEILRLENAMEEVRTDIYKTYENQNNKVAKNILETHTFILEDNELIEKITRTIEKEYFNAEWAVRIITKEYMHKFAIMEDEYFQQRTHDVNDIALHIINKLGSNNKCEKNNLDAPKIIVANTLLPMQFLRLPRKNIAGIILEKGGKTTHVTIIAKAFSIPMIINVKNISKILPKQNLILDANTGQIILNANEHTIKVFEIEDEKKKKEKSSQEEKVQSLKHCTKGQSNYDFPN